MLNKNLDKIIEEVKPAKIVAATKYVDVDVMLELRLKGIKDFGCNRVDAFLEKYEKLKPYEDITWHFIGTLQANKCKYMINKISYLHSLDSLNLAKEINKHRFNPLNCFLEVNLTRSKSKHGLLKEEVIPFLEAIKIYPKVKVIGLMTMTEESETDLEKFQTFKELADLKNELQKAGYPLIKELSMGMSDDYKEALKAHSSFVRLGRILFRNE